jgi:hypothetical protein
VLLRTSVGGQTQIAKPLLIVKMRLLMQPHCELFSGLVAFVPRLIFKQDKQPDVVLIEVVGQEQVPLMIIWPAGHFIGE